MMTYVIWHLPWLVRDSLPGKIKRRQPPVCFDQYLVEFCSRTPLYLLNQVRGLD